MAIAVGILDKLGLRPGSRFGRAVMLGIPIAALIGGVGTPAGTSINLLGLVMIEQAGGDRVPFLHWMAIGIPMVAILLPVAAWVLVKFFPAGLVISAVWVVLMTALLIVVGPLVGLL